MSEQQTSDKVDFIKNYQGTKERIENHQLLMIYFVMYIYYKISSIRHPSKTSIHHSPGHLTLGKFHTDLSRSFIAGGIATLAQTGTENVSQCLLLLSHLAVSQL